MSEKCNGRCRPTNCFAHGRRLVMNLSADGPYEREQLHFPCNQPGCDAARLCREEDEKSNWPKPGKPQRPTGDAELDRLDAELRAILRKSGLNY